MNAESKDGRTSLHLATHTGQLKIVEHLLKFGANVNAVNNSGSDEDYRPRYSASGDDGEKIIKLLIKNGETSLHLATRMGHLKMLEHLLEYGANVNTVYRTSGRMEGYTPLHLAARSC